MARVRAVKPEDAGAWLQLRHALWPEGSEAEHREEIDLFFAGEFPRDPWAVLLAEDGDGLPIGLAELSLRSYAEGCRTSPVAYLEGWFVVPEARGQCVGRALIATAESWARSMGCSELASDTSPDDDVSAAAHRASGFVDAGTVRCFRKEL
jgi:aminoglycoside 6'-N-acetyltransferase I